MKRLCSAIVLATLIALLIEGGGLGAAAKAGKKKGENPPANPPAASPAAANPPAASPAPANPPAATPPAATPPAANPPAADEAGQDVEGTGQGLKLTGPKGAKVTDKMVCDAIEKGRQYLLGTAGADGILAPGGQFGSSYTALAFMTLAYMGEHPNRPQISKTLDFLLGVNVDGSFGGRQGYAAPITVMGFAYVYHKLQGEKREIVRLKMRELVGRFVSGQAENGGWRYKLAGGKDYDLSNTQWPILAFREANLVGIEFPADTLRKAQELYFKLQQPDGGWIYREGGKAPRSYGSMTAGGVASLFIINDVLDPYSGCPCAGGRSQLKGSEAERRMDAGLQWLGKHFTATENPLKGTGNNQALYWLYSAERVGIAAGYKYFGNHNWYREGAETLLQHQSPNGSWGSLHETCFALLFLYKGRAPLLFNKLQFDGIWNAHRRDIANLTNYIENAKEQPFHWQIVELERSTLQELHEAPLLYICPEQIGEKAFTEAHKKKLRAFTDTGGTILFEASCGNANVRTWFARFAKEVWPEWPLRAIGPDHGSFKDPNPLKQRPEILGISDGVRTCVFYAMDDISCSWQTRAVAGREYLFKWGINLYTYATDGAPLRAKLADRTEELTDRYKQPVKAGPRTTLKIARVRHGGNWEAGANYGGLKVLAGHVKAKAGLTLEVKETGEPPVTRTGVAPAELAGYDAALIAGSGPIDLTDAEKAALKAYAGQGGMLWFEGAAGSGPFEEGLRKLCADMKWELRLLPNTHGLMTGRMEGGTGYDLTRGVKFSYWFGRQRLGRPYAEFFGVFDGEKMIGIYSPLDILYSITGYEAWHSRGYQEEDAAAVGTNLAIYLSTRAK